ncbi:hypothetical protein [Corallococcus sp. AB038B]|uniref:hypothetical protein n=1 Tax=Corallococcus sp. AB038B TaxID=2316718 RepID=UPI000EE2A748|nr:hypothetical protein [Corallococcus sp. AB038B]RKH93583.1 hypothetical protein D7Y04_39960 [Corallococcus sp. AB038B]
MSLSRMSVVKRHVTTAAPSLHEEAMEPGGKLPANAERVAHLVDDALREANREAQTDVRGPEDWAAM